MTRLLLLCLIFQAIAFGYSYNDLILKAQSAIFPKVLLLDRQLDEKLVDGKVVYAILYEKGDFKTAKEVSRLIREEFNHHLEKYRLEIRLIDYETVTDELKATALYALNSENHMHKVAQIAVENDIVTFAYDTAHLKDGFLLSLMVEKVTVIYLNKEMLHSYSVDFIDSLFQIVRFTND